MTVQDTSGDSSVQRPAASGTPENDKIHPAISTESQDGESRKNALAGIKREEIIFVLPGKGDKQGSYLIFSLSEDPTANGDKPFVLNIVQCKQHELADDLSGFVLSQDSSPPTHLSSPRELHVVVSTGSGLRRAETFYQEVLCPLLDAVGLQPSESEDARGYRVTVTKNSSTIREFARELGADAGAGGKTVVLLSGDGGVVDLLNGLDHASHPPRTPTIALLPLGTGNALFHSLHKPHYSTGAENPGGPSPLVVGLRTLFKTTTTAAPLPTFKASFSPGATLISGPDFEEAATAAENPPAASNTGNDGDGEQQQHHHHHHHHRHHHPAVTHLVGAIVASYGFHASLVWESDTPAYRVHGDKRFGMAAGELLKVGHAYDARVEVRRRRRRQQQQQQQRDAVHGGGGDGGEDDGFSVLVVPRGEDGGDGGGRRGGGRGRGKFNYVLATLVSNLEKTFTISPAGRPLDGRLRLVYFGDVGGDKTMQIMMAAYRDGAHVAMPEVGYEEVEEVRVTVDEDDPRWRKVCIDGSIVELEKGGWMRVEREEGTRLKVLVDAGTD
ncbi:hypothetical protein MYCTH_2310076 [Thermothelomyces thermophilus ATCC 42464]|uniref:DAGKc domain-containing protein n=1 Tax=Thermothelomyces thermophilus (strain ATCC 42464 / BCRC 31852 / DSM 1799) TaxID=573729 RepID=G2QL10_THET4|nr:uncharacterized protein MYCTH_2310076 [Thermothelomyces thermophilus ATCC 42464]AEO60642.1 hypothetical protein MYCTH_2310076 [Thermothelomyces thermophilus ATCC 42464]